MRLNDMATKLVILGLFVALAALGLFVFSVSYGASGDHVQGGEPWYVVPGSTGGFFLAVVFGVAAVAQLVIVIVDWLRRGR